MDVRQLIGLLGVLIAAMTSEFNDQVTSIALRDVQGGLAISHDPGTWIQSLYISAEIVGMAVSPWLLVTFTLRRWTLFSIVLCGASTFLIPFSPDIEAVYTLRILQGFSGGLIIPLLMTTALRAAMTRGLGGELGQSGAAPEGPIADRARRHEMQAR